MTSAIALIGVAPGECIDMERCRPSLKPIEGASSASNHRTLEERTCYLSADAQREGMGIPESRLPLVKKPRVLRIGAVVPGTSSLCVRARADV